MFFSSLLIEALKSQHKKMKTEIETMKEPDISQSEKQLSFARFLPTFISHTNREERIVYTYMKLMDDESLHLMAYEGKTKHLIADQLIEDMLSEDLPDDQWSVCAKVLAELVEQHLDEEENYVFPTLKRFIDSETDLDLFERYESQSPNRIEHENYSQQVLTDVPRWS